VPGPLEWQPNPGAAPLLAAAGGYRSLPERCRIGPRTDPSRKDPL